MLFFFIFTKSNLSMSLTMFHFSNFLNSDVFQDANASVVPVVVKGQKATARIRMKAMREPAMMAHRVAMDKMGGEDATFDETSAAIANQAS